jgi:hypothetical protein
MPSDVVRIGGGDDGSGDGMENLGDCTDLNNPLNNTSVIDAILNIIRQLANCESASGCAESNVNKPACIVCCGQQRARENKICTYAKGTACEARCYSLPDVVGF